MLSTIRHFRDEWEAHILDKHCEAGVCATMFKARCTNACPADVDVPGFVSLVGEKRFDEALVLHRERNPLASICGRVCFHPCESKCQRAGFDAPVAIRGVKRFMTEQETVVALPEVLVSDENAKRKVAVIGSGPAGLSCAYFLARLGYKPTIFEAASTPGGMLVQAIPAYRLPREELGREISMIQEMGVTLECDKALGRDFTLQGLHDDGFEAVFLGVGAPQGSNIGVPGEDGQGVTEALSFLKTYNVDGTVEVGKRVAVIGGGNSAIDAARTALRLGADQVTILYRRTRAQMPAWAEEIDAAEDERIVLQPLVAPVEIVHDAAGAGRREVSPDDPGRLRLERPSPPGRWPQRRLRRRVRPGHRRHRPVARQRAAVQRRLGRDPKKGWLKTDKDGRTSVEWIFAGGDAVTGPASAWPPSEPARRPPSPSIRCSPAPTMPSGVATSRSTPRSTPTPIPSRRRAPSMPELAASARVGEASTKSSSRGRPRRPSPKRGAACVVTTERPVPRPR